MDYGAEMTLSLHVEQGQRIPRDVGVGRYRGKGRIVHLEQDQRTLAVMRHAAYGKIAHRDRPLQVARYIILRSERRKWHDLIPDDGTNISHNRSVHST